MLGRQLPTLGRALPVFESQINARHPCEGRREALNVVARGFSIFILESQYLVHALRAGQNLQVLS